MANNSVTASEILKHRALRKRLGLVGCKDGSDMPLTSMKGISWRPTDPKNPGCFCTDCRDTWDADGAIDAELVNEGNTSACYTYEALLPKTWDLSPPEPFPQTRRITPELIAPPAARRDVMNEAPTERLRNDLLDLIEPFRCEPNSKKLDAVMTVLHFLDE